MARDAVTAMARDAVTAMEVLLQFALLLEYGPSQA
jgi:hypothetical protein